MARLDVPLESIENREAGFVRQADIENNRTGSELRGQGQRFLGGTRNQGAESHFAGQIAQNTGESVIVLNNQQDPLPVRRPFAVVFNSARLSRGLGARRFHLKSLSRGNDRDASSWLAGGDFRRIVKFGNRNSESATLP